MPEPKPAVNRAMQKHKILAGVANKVLEKMDGIKIQRKAVIEKSNELTAGGILGKWKKRNKLKKDKRARHPKARGKRVRSNGDDHGYKVPLAEVQQRPPATVPIPESPEMMESEEGLVESKCIVLEPDAEEIIEVSSASQSFWRMMGTLMGLSEDQIQYLDQSLGQMDLNRNEFYPKEQCIFAPRMESDNVVRILGHYSESTSKPKGAMKLLVSNQPIKEQEGQCPVDICESLPDAECVVVTAERSSAQFTSRMDAQRGMGQTVVWLIHNVEGQKYVRSLDARLQVFSVFRDVIHLAHSQSPKLAKERLALKVVPPRAAGEMNMLFLGGSSYHNVLLQQIRCPGARDEVRVEVREEVREPIRPHHKPHGPHGRDGAVEDSPGIPLSVNPLFGDQVPRILARKLIGSSSESSSESSSSEDQSDGTRNIMKRLEKQAEGSMKDCKVAVVAKVKEGTGRERVRMDLIPLIYDDDELRSKEMASCIVDREHVNGCAVHIRRDLDYDIRIANIGSVVADVEVFAYDVPMESPMDLGFQEEAHHHGVWSSGCHVAMYWGIGVLLVALFAIIMNRLNRRRARRARKRVMSASHIVGLDVTLTEPTTYTIM